ncbi:MAG: hypothetical protein AB8B50_15590, partial [Pirellulaceae bacterium]
MTVPASLSLSGTSTDDAKPIYLNHAGTSWPKPAEVQQAASEAFGTCASQWEAQFHADHERVAHFFGIASPSRLLLTPGCTSALSV